MKQVVQSFRTGAVAVQDIPAPGARDNRLLVQTAASLVSAGTERMIVDFAEKNLLQKARSRPDLVRQALDKAQREGFLTTLDAVRNRLDQPLPLGYSSAGVVLDVPAAFSSNGVPKVGDRVACAGGNLAVHAEVASVPPTLVVRLPDNVDFESASFATLGAISLQGIRLADVKLGEIVAVIGLGLLGQLAVQMLKAAGCVVLGMDLQESRAALARHCGTDAAVTSREELLSLVQQFSHGHGADATLITADTKSNEPVELAGELTRANGVVVAVGAVGMTIPRKVYYEKEIAFRISRSYGPGRYDPEYEEKGIDYPYSYVRWTEQRNMEAFVQLLAAGSVNVKPLISHRIEIADATRAYDVITGKAAESFLGVVLTYPERPDADPLARKVFLSHESAQPADSSKAEPVVQIRLGLIGAGNFANATLLPALKNLSGIEFVGIASAGGLTSRAAADRFGFKYCTTDAAEVFRDSQINTVAILTRHHLHAPQVIAALDAGKHAFVEKPLCLSEEELSAVIAAQERNPARTVMVGFNRRFAPFVVELKEHLRELREPLMLHLRMNAGHIPASHWVHDPVVGGGRLLGEACHFIDLAIFLAGSAPVKIATRALPNAGRYNDDNLLITMEFENGSLASVAYVANGEKGFGKEFVEVSGGGLSARLEDYRALTILRGSKRIKRTARLRHDKGHRGEWEALAAHLCGKAPAPISFAEIVASTRATLAAQRSLARGEPMIMAEAVL